MGYKLGKTQSPSPKGIKVLLVLLGNNVRTATKQMFFKQPKTKSEKIK